MNLDYARDLWSRAENALRSAQALVKLSPDDAASRAYYAAFHSVSAALVLQGKSYTRHSAVRSAVHRDLVRTGIWSVDLGANYDALWELRDLGDYGGINSLFSTPRLDPVSSYACRTRVSLPGSRFSESEIP